ncbi:MAG TPA: sugar transferase [Candidatus Limiplasma sp.]|nr:sugar transferase [Candidatus Limiplasma sp.]HRX07864.1 sugar transferase [Candidatus Limiplasma sp.]
MPADRENAANTHMLNRLYVLFIKRALDMVFAAAALVVLSPLLAVIAVLVWLQMKPPALFQQVRPGRKNAAGQETLFTLYKFRTMTNRRDAHGTLLPDAHRLTGFGKLLRTLSLDELPELWNILIGDMSFVGPRPQLVRDMVFMTGEQRQRHSVRPGLTGLAQINGRNNILWEDKLAYDLQYIRRITFLGDMKIILITILRVFKAENINDTGMATAQDLGDYLLESGKITQAEYRLRQQEALSILEGRSACSKH